MTTKKVFHVVCYLVEILVLSHQELLELYYVAELTEPSLHSAAVLSPPEKLGALNQVELSTSTVKLCFIPWFSEGICTCHHIFPNVYWFTQFCLRNSSSRILISKANLGISAQVKLSQRLWETWPMKGWCFWLPKPGCTVDGGRTVEAWAARPDISTL